MIALSDYALAITEIISQALDYLAKNTQRIKKNLMFEQEQMLAYDFK